MTNSSEYAHIESSRMERWMRSWGEVSIVWILSASWFWSCCTLRLKFNQLLSLVNVTALIHELLGYIGFVCYSYTYSVHEGVVSVILLVETTYNLWTNVIVIVITKHWCDEVVITPRSTVRFQGVKSSFSEFLYTSIASNGVGDLGQLVRSQKVCTEHCLGMTEQAIFINFQINLKILSIGYKYQSWSSDADWSYRVRLE